MLDTLLVATVIASAPPVARADRTHDAEPTAPVTALAPGSVDSVVVEKAARRLTLYVAGEPARVWRVALGKNPVGPKRLRGDYRTPEGLYVIQSRNPRSKYHRSLRISYPNAVDRFLAAEKGYTAGGDVMIHGLPPGTPADVAAVQWQSDWTEGCVAITNEQIDEMWSAVRDGTRIRIRP